MKKLMIILLATLVSVAGGSLLADDAGRNPRPRAEISGQDRGGLDDPAYQPLPWHNMLLAQLDEGEMRGPGGKGRRQQGNMQRRQKHLDQLRTLKMIELLDLSADQEMEFLVTYRRARENQRDLEEQKRQLLDDIAAEVHSERPQNDNIMRLVGEISDLERQRHSMRKQFLQEAGAILSPAQLGALVVFQARFDAELLEQVRRFRERMRNPDDPGPGGFQNR